MDAIVASSMNNNALLQLPLLYIKTYASFKLLAVQHSGLIHSATRQA